MNFRRGQQAFGMSFGMIFSIIIIIAILGIGFFVIQYFLGLANCTNVGKFYDSFEERVNKAWSGSISQEIFTGTLPSNINAVCFGDINTNQIPSRYQRLYEDLRDLRFYENSNLFLSPWKNACDGELAHYNLKNVQFEEEFFCIPVESGEVNIKISMDRFDNLVTISEG